MIDICNNLTGYFLAAFLFVEGQMRRSVAGKTHPKMRWNWMMTMTDMGGNSFKRREEPRTRLFIA
ncbi:hypothetical protein JZ751_004543 [Albula glossodonta]|uniref:Uncharacterized protein n=1 Tax=Albula glossodonta TaxID=121402 RepID=A0A8T2NGD9_9TELE|nr:hypothetical protein JZ751_004543 [Albula glossodonta]